MLILTRHENERIRLKVGEVEIWLCLAHASGGKAVLTFDAPQSVSIDREELAKAKDEGRKAA